MTRAAMARRYSHPPAAATLQEVTVLSAERGLFVLDGEDPGPGKDRTHLRPRSKPAAPQFRRIMRRTIPMIAAWLLAK